MKKRSVVISVLVLAMLFLSVISVMAQPPPPPPPPPSLEEEGGDEIITDEDLLPGTSKTTTTQVKNTTTTTTAPKPVVPAAVPKPVVPTTQPMTAPATLSTPQIAAPSAPSVSQKDIDALKSKLDKITSDLEKLNQLSAKLDTASKKVDETSRKLDTTNTRIDALDESVAEQIAAASEGGIEDLASVPAIAGIIINSVLLSIIVYVLLAYRDRKVKKKQAGSQLRTYLMQALRGGAQFYMVRQQLVRNGWAEEDVNKAYKEMNKGMSQGS